MSTFAVLGLGNWGTALANHLALKGFQVVGWSANPAVVEGINLVHRNPSYLSDVVLHPGFTAASRLQDVVSADFIVIALPSHALCSVVGELKALPSIGGQFISGVKGLETNSGLTPLQLMARELPHQRALVALSGPCFARDLVLRRPAGVVAASDDRAAAALVAERFTSDYMRVYTSDDPHGVELGGIVKNVIALAAGVCDGLELGESARAGLITRGLAEMTRFAVALGARERTLAGLSGLGDLIMTATSPLSRNRTVGIRLGRGERLPDIIATLGSTAEAVFTTPQVVRLAKKEAVEMPITEAVADLLSGEIEPIALVKRLISRPMKPEFEA